jgi:hypothetical protein
MQLREQKGPGMNTKRRYAMSVLGLGVLVVLLVGSFQLVTLLPTLPATWQVQECASQRVHLKGTPPATVTCVQKRLATFKRQQNGAYVRQSSTLLTPLDPQSSGTPWGCISPSEMCVYQNASYGGNVMGVDGTGVLNSTDYTMEYRYICTPWPYKCQQFPVTWNDQISSFKSYQNQGYFCWDINAGSCNYGFPRNQNTSYVGNTWNDQISSVVIASS